MVICYMVIKDLDKLRRSFRLLLEVTLDIDDEDKYATNHVNFMYIAQFFMTARFRRMKLAQICTWRRFVTTNCGK